MRVLHEHALLVWMEITAPFAQRRVIRACVNLATGAVEQGDARDVALSVRLASVAFAAGPEEEVESVAAHRSSGREVARN
jgi:hypothetical protein